MADLALKRGLRRTGNKAAEFVATKGDRKSVV